MGEVPAEVEILMAVSELVGMVPGLFLALIQ
jgi:hypothetical protein